MLFTHENAEFVTVLTISRNRIDASCAAQFGEDAKDVLAYSQNDCIVDLSGVQFMDSTGIGALVGLLKFCGTERRLVLCGLRPPISKIMRLTRLDAVFMIASNIHAAHGMLETTRQAAG